MGSYVAKWKQIKKLQKMEDGKLVKIIKLTYGAASFKPIESQKVGTCLIVFCDETVNALGMQDENIYVSVTLIAKITEFWKIVNVKSSFEGLRLNHSLRDVISSFTYLRLDDLMKIAELAVSMAASHENHV